MGRVQSGLVYLFVLGDEYTTRNLFLIPKAKASYT